MRVVRASVECGGCPFVRGEIGTLNIKIYRYVEYKNLIIRLLFTVYLW